jgi:hypothetical protein
MNKFRFRIFTKLAQAQPSTAQTQASTAAAATQVVSAPLPSFVATAEYPNIINGFGPNFSAKINELADELNRILQYYSNGKYSMKGLKSTNFQTITDAMPDIINLVNFANLVYVNFFNHGNKFAKQLTPAEIKQRLDAVANSSSFNNLKDVPVSGQLAQNTKGSGSNRAKIQTILNNMKSLIPS